MKNEDFIKLEKNYSLCQENQHHVVFQKGDGVWLWDVEGRQYFDVATLFHNAIFGHSPTRLVDVLLEQAKSLSLNTSFLYNDRLGPFLKKLSEMTGFEKCVAFSSTYQALFEVMRYGIVWAKKVKQLSAEQIKIVFVTSGQFYLDFPKELFPYCSFIAPEHVDRLKDFNFDLSMIIVNPIDWNEESLLIHEDKLNEIKNIAQRYQSLVILDESFVPPGYFGKNFLFHYYDNFSFDAIIFGEFLGAGMIPLAAAVFRESVYTAAGQLESAHNSIYPIAAAIGLEAICLLEEGFLADKALTKSNQIKSFLLQRDLIKSVQGNGLILRINFEDSICSQDLQAQFMEKSVFCHTFSSDSLIFAPPLSMSDQDMEKLIKYVEMVLPEKKDRQQALSDITLDEHPEQDEADDDFHQKNSHQG